MEERMEEREEHGRRKVGRREAKSVRLEEGIQEDRKAASREEEMKGM